MTVLVCLAALFFCPLFASMGIPAYGHENNEWYFLEPIVTSAARTEQPAEEVAANIRVISKEDMESIPAHNVAEALNYVPGLFIFFAGGLGSQATASIQGSQERQVTVFIDGVRLNMQSNPIVDLSYIPLENVERIEVYEGAASSVWGSGLGGVINILTAEPSGKPIAGSAKAGGGSNNTFQAQMSVDSTVSDFSGVLMASHIETDGPIEHSAFHLNHIYTKLRYQIGSDSDLTFSLDYSDGQTENPIPVIPDFYEESTKRRSFQTLTYRAEPLEDLYVELRTYYQRLTNTQDRTFINNARTVNNFDLTERLFGSSAKAVWKTHKNNTFVGGFDGEWGGYDLSTLGPDTVSTRNTAVYANDTLSIGPVSLQGGARFDDNKDFDSEVSPSFGVAYRLDKPKAVLRFQVARAYSAPPLNYLFFPDRGNPDLQPETGVTYQLGADLYPLKFLKFSVDLFWADVENLIRFDPVRDMYVNDEEVTRRGVEASLNAKLPYGFGAFLATTIVNAKDDRTDKTVKDLPGLLYDVQLTHAYKEILFQSITGNYVWYNSSLAETKDSKFLFDYLVRVNAPAKVGPGDLSFYGAVHNLFNSSRYQIPALPNPSRWFEAGMRYSF